MRTNIMRMGSGDTVIYTDDFGNTLNIYKRHATLLFKDSGGTLSIAADSVAQDVARRVQGQFMTSLSDKLSFEGVGPLEEAREQAIIRDMSSEQRHNEVRETTRNPRPR